jgi:hypothetical protein
MFTTVIASEAYRPAERHTTTAAAEIEIMARAEEKKMALLAGEYKGMGRKGKSLLAALASLLSL